MTKTNWRGESAKRCWLCGSTNTVVIDPMTRECRECGSHYGVFDTTDRKEEHEGSTQTEA